MAKILTATAATISLSLGAALAANYHDYHPWSQPHNAGQNYHPEYVGPVLFGRYPYAHPTRAINATTDQRVARSGAVIRCESANNSRQPKATP
jgi:hypothetical protein